jgi:cell division protein FtsI (penicillin-binding protein 3)
VAQGEGDWAATTATDTTVQVTTRNLPAENSGLIPNVEGMGLRDALYILENRGLRVRPVGSGMVRKQWPAPGTRAVKGTTITIELAT